MNDAVTEENVRERIDKLAKLRESIAEAIVGQDEVVEQLLIGLLAGGHCLLEGVPGLAKTLTISTLAKVLHLHFQPQKFRVLFPDGSLGTTPKCRQFQWQN